MGKPKQIVQKTFSEATRFSGGSKALVAITLAAGMMFAVSTFAASEYLPQGTEAGRFSFFKQNANQANAVGVGSGKQVVAFSQKLSDLRAGEIVEAQGEAEVSVTGSVPVYTSAKIILASGPNDINGREIVPSSAVTVTPDIHHWPFVKTGTLTVPKGAGSYVNLVVYGNTSYARTSQLKVERLGHLDVTVYHKR